MKMSAEEMKTKALVVLRGIIRFFWVFISNMYSIPAHLLAMTLLKPLRAYAPELYYYIDGVSFRWLQCLVGHWMYSAGYTVAECGDNLSELEDEEVLLVSNHQSTADVPSLMYALQFHGRILDKVLWIMDIMFKHTNFGLVSQMRGDFFIRQGKETRSLQGAALQKHIKDYYIPRKREWVVIFPEGHFFWKQKKRSQAYGKKNGLPHLEHCLLPRAGAIHALLQSLSPRVKQAKANALDEPEKTLKWFVDVTIAYPNGVPLDLQTIVAGHRPPMVTTLHYRKYPMSEVPVEQEELLHWLHQRYVEKDKLLEEFYKSGKFPVTSEAKDYIREARPLHLSAQRLFGLHFFFITLTCLFIYAAWSVIGALWGMILFVF